MLSSLSRVFPEGAVVALLAGLSILLTPLSHAAEPASDLSTTAGGQSVIFSSSFETGNTNAWALVIGDPRPMLDPIGNLAVDLGTILSITLTASDPTDDPLSFSVSPLPLPTGATLDSASGAFTFQPGAAQVGQHVLTFTVSDGQFTDSETVILTVNGPPKGGQTGLTGRVLDANDAAVGTMTPIVGVTVSLLGTGFSTTTDASGNFTLVGTPSGDRVLDLDTATAAPAPDGSPYAGFRENYFLIDGVTNVVERPLFLPRLDMGSETQVDPEQTTIVDNPELGATLTLVPHSAKNPDGSDFDGVITISEVPREFAPAELPSELDPGLLITIQPVGVTFDPPAPLTFPDVDGLPPGALVDLWSLDPDRGVFVVVGTGEAQGDGTIQTIGGGVRAADWHTVLPQPPRVKSSDDEDPECDGCCDPASCSSGSSVVLRTGELTEEVTLPAYRSQGQERAASLRYSSLRAHPTKLMPLDVTVPAAGPVPPLMSYRVRVGGVEQDEPVFVDTSVLDQGGASGPIVIGDPEYRISAFYDASDLPTGVYPISVRTTSHFPNSNVSTDPEDEIVLVNDRGSAFGAGWGMQGLQRIYEQDDGTLLLVDGDGIARRFSVSFAPDLTGWMEELNYPDGSFRAAEWVVAPDGLSVTQIEFNAFGLSTFISPFDFYGEALFRIRVNTDFDDDIIGLVLGYQRPVLSAGDPENDMGFILFDWKQTSQDLFCGTRPEGTRLLQILGDIPSGDATCVFTAHPPPPGQARVLGTDFGDGRGWQDETEHEIRVVYERNRIQIDVDGEPVYDVSGIFPEGRIGFYNHSQLDVTYSVSYPTNITVLEGPPGDVTTITRNPDATFTRAFPDGTTIDFDAAGLMTTLTDRNGNATNYGYDISGRLTTITDPIGLETTLNYAGGTLDTITDPAGRVTEFIHDGNGNLVDISYPDGTTRSFDYDHEHRLISQVDQRGLETNYEFDFLGRLERSLLPDGAERSTRNVQGVGVVDTSGGLGSEGNPAPVIFPESAISTFTDGEGRTVSMAGDRFGQAAETTDSAGLVTIREFAPEGPRTREELPSGHVRTATYDELGNRLSVTDEEIAGTFTFTYEQSLQQLETFTDPFGNTTTMTHDPSGNPTSITTQESRLDTFTYTPEGQLDTWVDRLGTTTDITYDTEGLIEQVDRGTGPTLRTTNFTRTVEGYLDTFADPEGRIYDLDYDAFGRPLSLTHPDGEAVTATRDQEGRLDSITPPGKPTHFMSYSNSGRLAGYHPPPIGGTVDTTYTFDLAQQLTQIDRPDGRSVEFTYDTAGRLSSTEIERGTTTYTYGPSSGLITSIEAPGSETLAFAYQGERAVGQTWSGSVAASYERTFDAAGRIATESVNGSNSITFAYDGDSLLTTSGPLTITRDTSSGLITASSLGQVTDTWTYNEFGELVGYQASHSGTPFFEYTLTLDMLGRIIAESETIGGVSTDYDYDYDLRGRLEQVDQNSALSAAYTYDDNSNRLTRSDGAQTETGTYDDQDRATTYNGATYAYRQSGELLSKTDSGGTTTYDYDENGNLLSVARPDGVVVSYVIDGLDRRIGKAIDGTLVQGFVYRDVLHPVAELDGSGAVVSRFIYGTRAHVPDVMQRGGVTYRLVSDQIGSVRLVVDTTSGAVAQRLDYDEFGRVLSDTNPGFQPFGFAGGLYDSDTGLVHFDARDYDPNVGRWTAKDPIGFAGGSPNLYEYVSSDPLRQFDPTGLQPSEHHQALQRIIDNFHEELTKNGLGPAPPAAGAPIGGFGGSMLTGNMTDEQITELIQLHEEFVREMQSKAKFDSMEQVLDEALEIIPKPGEQTDFGRPVGGKICI